MKNFVFIVATLFLCIVAGETLHAQIPRTLSYQGVLTDASTGKPRPDGNYNFTFRFYASPTGGTPIWEEQRSLRVTNGLFSTALGETVPFGVNVKFDRQYWLGIQVGTEPELAPRIALTSVGYSMSSLRADTARVATEVSANGNIAVNGNLWVGSWSDHYIELADSRKRIRSTADPDGAIIFYTHSLQVNPSWEFRDLRTNKLIGRLDASNGSFEMGVWDDHELILADRRKSIRSTADPDGAMIFYTHSIQVNPRWEFRDMKDGALRASINGNNGNAFFEGQISTRVLEIRGGADLAEPFEMSHPEPLPAGALVVIDPDTPGKMKQATEPYDQRVAGVISGAGGINPGITLKQEGVLEAGQHVALSGKVYALATTVNGPIQPGDLLTTSKIPGHAMKATDKELAYGSVIGKAMSPLEKGEGLVLVLIQPH